MEHDIKIIALDLDGTLLDSEKRLSPRNKAALERAAAKGVLIVPTTGRVFSALPANVCSLPFVRYAITVNGAQVYDLVADAPLARDEMPVDLVVSVMELLDGYDVIYDCYRNNQAWMTEDFIDKAEIYATDEHYLASIRQLRHPVPELKRHLRETRREGDIQKAMLFARVGGGEATAALLREIAAAIAAKFPEVVVTASTWNNLEVNTAAATKGGALLRLAEKFGFAPENCMAFGDGLNDLSMIQAAGIGVAMANAIPEDLAAADFVTATNDDDGVAIAIEKFCLGE